MKFCSITGCWTNITDNQAETTEKLFGKSVCLMHEETCRKEADVASGQFSFDSGPYNKCGFKIKNGKAIKMIGQAEIQVDIGLVEALKPGIDCIEIGGYAYKSRVNPDVDKEVKALFDLIRSKTGGAGKVKKENPAPKVSETTLDEIKLSNPPKRKSVTDETNPTEPTKTKEVVGNVPAIPKPTTTEKKIIVEEKKIIVEEKKMTETYTEKMPATTEKASLPGKPLTDAERDEIIERAKAKRFLENRGSSYKVQGKERPDSHMIQKVANERGISLEILETTHTEAFVKVVVRAHLGDRYCDAVVHHVFQDEFLLKTMEMISKNPGILDHWEGQEPVIKEGSKIRIFENGKETFKDAKYQIIHALLTWKKFAMRDARTKAGAIAEAMLLNQDFREPEEKQSEGREVALVQESVNNRRGERVVA